MKVLTIYIHPLCQTEQVCAPSPLMSDWLSDSLRSTSRGSAQRWLACGSDILSDHSWHQGPAILYGFDLDSFSPSKIHTSKMPQWFNISSFSITQRWGMVYRAAKLHISRNINWRLCLVNYADMFPLILTFFWVKSASLQFVRVKDIWGSDWSTVLSLSLFLITPSLPLRVRPSLSSHDLFPSYSTSSPLLSSPLSHLSPTPPLFTFFYISFSSFLPQFSFLSDLSQCLFPEETVKSGFTGMQDETAPRLVLPPTPRYCSALPTVPISLCDTNVASKMWLIPNHQRLPSAKYLKMEFAQGGLEGDFSHPPLLNLCGMGFSTTMFGAISPPTPWLHPFFSTKALSNESSMDFSNITALVLHNACFDVSLVWLCLKRATYIRPRTVLDATVGTLVMDSGDFPSLWRTLVFGRVQRLVCLKKEAAELREQRYTSR